MSKNISYKIKYLYFGLTIGMVMYHSRWLYDYNINYSIFFDRKFLALYTEIADHIGNICLCFFFFMSAFWFYNNLNNYKDVLKKWNKRIKTLLIPFLLWTLIIAIYKVSNSEISISFNNLYYYIFEAPVAGPLWYILGLLILQLFSPLVVFIKKNKKITTIIFSIITIYIFLRSFNVIPKFLVFKKWWWYNNLISYTPVYILGCYIGMYYPEIILKKKYNEKKYTIIGIIALVISFILWHIFRSARFNLFIIYSITILVGIWFVLKPGVFKKDLPKCLNCGFYIYALHNPILIPKTQDIIKLLVSNKTVYGFEVVAIKIVQLYVIVLIAILIKFIASKVFSKEVNYYLTGGR